jgi:cytochrome c oxidase cbb3-type subunit III
MTTSFRSGAFFAATLLLGIAASQGLRAQSPAAQSPTPQTQNAPSPAPASATQSPASQRPPQTATPQSYSAAQIEAGQSVFLQQCAFCHGRDAGGGETGPDLTRSTVVTEDVRGDKIGPVVRGGRADKGMPQFSLSDQDLAAVVAFVHDQKMKAESAEGGRQKVDVADLQTGNAEAGRQFFNGAGKCTTCHSATGDLAGVATRLQGLALMQRMLYPGGRGAISTATVTVTLPSGQTVSGKLAYRDEFTIALRDDAGRYRSWQTDEVKFKVDAPLEAHVAQLGKYTDDEVHNVLAYLQTLK